MKPSKHQSTNKDAKIYVARSVILHNLLFCPHTLCMNYVANTFVLVTFSERSKQLLCFVHCQGQKREQKSTTKNFVKFQNHSPLLTVFQPTWLLGIIIAEAGINIIVVKIASRITLTCLAGYTMIVLIWNNLLYKKTNSSNNGEAFSSRNTQQICTSWVGLQLGAQ